MSVNESMFEIGQHNIEKLLEFSHPIVTFFPKCSILPFSRLSCYYINVIK